MKYKKIDWSVAAVYLAIFVSGCHDKYEKYPMASPACVDLAKTKDPSERAELEKRCASGGPEFKPSPVKNW